MIRRAIVTGASRGIGKAIAVTLHKSGWEVLNLDLAPSDETNIRHIEVDLTNADELCKTLDEITSSGPVTGLVNNAGIAIAATLEKTTPEDFDKTVAINMKAPMMLAKAVIPGMRNEGFGRIVNISSRAHMGKTHRTAYSATKGGILSMGRVWALEHARDGITVNTIAPGPIRTELFDLANPPDMPRTAEIIDTVPVGRIGLPDDIANAVRFFMDENSSFITGQTLYVCGGITLARGGS